MDPAGQLEKLEQPGLDRHGPPGRVAVDRADLAGRAEDAHLLLERLDQVEGLQGDLGPLLVLPGVEKHLELLKGNEKELYTLLNGLLSDRS